MKEIKIGDNVEQCVERSDYPPDKVRQILKDETVAVLGYGVQGRGQSLNMRDNGIKVIVDPKSLAYIDGTELDFAREGLNEGFRFNNPNVKDECGCGESFRV